MDTSIEMVRGTTQTFRVSIKNQDKTPYVVQAGEILRFGLKEDPPAKHKYLVKKEFSTESEDNGAYTFTLEPEDTINLPTHKKYCYDIGLQDGDQYYCVIPFSPFTLIPNVTKIEEVEGEEEEENEG